jgi:pSer/pThr/pTyr-binding forkhead associated (FHA) protein
MSGLIVLALRLILTLTLYGFLGWALFMLWRDVQRQGQQLANRRIPPISISIRQGRGSPVIRHFSQSEITLGRDPGCDIPVTDETVSTRHIQLTFHHGQWWLDDLDSTNGTKLNKLPVTMSTVITSGDEIQCGKTRLVVSLTSNAVVSPTQQLEKTNE